MPKLLVVGGTETRLDGGPLLNLVDADAQANVNVAVEDEYVQPTSAGAQGKGGLWDDMAEDWGLSGVKEIRKSIFKLLG
jgi:hypothetical protein